MDFLTFKSTVEDTEGQDLSRLTGRPMVDECLVGGSQFAGKKLTWN